jgi:hypothetical protein
VEFSLKKRFKKLIVIILAFFVFLPLPVQKAGAMDPVTIAILAPVALKGARAASPYVIRGMQNAGRQMIVIGKDVTEIFCLPLGVVQTTLGAPFGFFGNGVQNIGSGVVAPFKMTWDILMLPLAMFGVSGG